MKFILHGEDKNGNEDELLIEGETIEELIEIGKHEKEQRGWVYAWSEEVR